MSGLPSAPDVGFDCYLIQVIKKLVNPLFCRYKLLNRHVVSGVDVHVGLCEHLICCTHSSEEVGLAHDAHELVLVDLTISIFVELINHGLELIITQIFLHLTCDSAQIS